MLLPRKCLKLVALNFIVLQICIAAAGDMPSDNSQNHGDNFQEHGSSIDRFDVVGLTSANRVREKSPQSDDALSKIRRRQHDNWFEYEPRSQRQIRYLPSLSHHPLRDRHPATEYMPEFHVYKEEAATLTRVPRQHNAPPLKFESKPRGNDDSLSESVEFIPRYPGTIRPMVGVSSDESVDETGATRCEVFRQRLHTCVEKCFRRESCSQETQRKGLKCPASHEQCPDPFRVYLNECKKHSDCSVENQVCCIVGCRKRCVPGVSATVV